MSIASFSGIASGIQWRDMIDQIMKLESRPADTLRSQIKSLESRSAALNAFRTRVQAFSDAADSLLDDAFRQFQVTLGGVAEGAAAPVSVSASTTAAPGSYDLRVLSLATAEKLGGDAFDSRSDALGLAGAFRINGVRVEVAATDSIDDVVGRINAANVGSDRSGVTASVLSTGTSGYRLVLTSDRTGVRGIDLADDAGGVLRGLGILDASTTIKHQTSNGAKSDGFADATTAIADLLDLSPRPAADISIGPPGWSFAVTIDLSADSLQTIASKINTAAAAAGSGITAAVVTETVEGETVQRLDIDGTTAFTDTDGILETLGILEGGRDAVAQEVRGAQLTDVTSGTAATASSLLTDLGSNGAAANVSAGDTLSLSGTRGDGSTFSFDYTIGAGDTVQTLLDRLNGVDGFQAGGRTATASIVDGRLTVTDDVGGDSRLALSIVAHNEGGGTLDFGEFETSRVGRARRITAGADAELEIDGAYLRRSSNIISDAIGGVTLTLNAAASDTTVRVDVARDTEAVVGAAETLVDTYNEIAGYVASQTNGASGGVLAGDSVVRSMRNLLREALQASIPDGVAGSYTRLGDVGIEIDRNGRFQLDRSKLEAALGDDFEAVRRLFGLHGSGSTNSLGYVGAGANAEAGTYDVVITQAASQATATSAGFGGTYVDDGTADTLSITDLASGETYAISLTDGMTLDQIVDALNTAFDEDSGPRISARAVGGELELVHRDHGNSAGFGIAFAAGGADGSGSLGLTAGSFAGTDVQGTIGGLAATGRGRVLTGDEGTAVEGLRVSYSGTATGAVGSMTFSRGIAAAVEKATRDFLGAGTGSITSATERIGENIAGIHSRIDRLDARLERRREQLVRQFTAMEMALSRAQSQSQWLTAQLGSLS